MYKGMSCRECTWTNNVQTVTCVEVCVPFTWRPLATWMYFFFIIQLLNTFSHKWKHRGNERRDSKSLTIQSNLTWEKQTKKETKQQRSKYSLKSFRVQEFKNPDLCLKSVNMPSLQRSKELPFCLTSHCLCLLISLPSGWLW